MWPLRGPAYSAAGHGDHALSQPDPFWDAVHDIRATDARYGREAYAFVLSALGVAARALPAERREDPVRRHLTGQELLASVVALARAEFGPMAATVFREWGLASSQDVGELVFQLVRAGQLSARPEDRPEDFAGVADLPALLAEGAEPGSPRSERRPGAPHRPA